MSSQLTESYRAGTPKPLAQPISYLVQGASGGGGNNYTGSKSSFENFTACLIAAPPPPITQRVVNASEDNRSELLTEGINIYPNPASDQLTLSIVPSESGNSRIELFSINGTKVFETSNGQFEKGRSYIRQINVSKLLNGIYLVRVWNGNAVTNKKIIINR